MRRLLLVAAFSLLPFSLSAAESADEIFQQAIVEFSQATKAKPEEQLAAYQAVRNLLDQLVDDFPTSDFAVSVLLSETIEGLDVTELDAFIAAGGTGLTPPSLKNGAAVNETDMVVDSTESETPTFPASEKERTRLTQDNLNRLGCAAGSPDGVIGRKTRGAISRYLTAKELSPAKFELGSDELLSILVQDSGTVCEPVPITAISFGILKGNWSFRSTCGIGSKPAKPDARGTLKLHTQMADGRLYGILSSADGYGGQLWLKIRGRQFTARISWPLIGRDNFGGGFADDARNFSGRTSNGCRISFWKS